MQVDETLGTFVNQLIEQAYTDQASDIHFETYQDQGRVRTRIDGFLHTIHTLSRDTMQRIITHLKVIAELDIAEKRFPQDGKIKLNNDKMIRINICPTLHLEKAVLRLTGNQSAALSLQELGMSKQQLDFFHAYLAMPQGLILIAGPTGSGKTMTLYAALRHLNQEAKNIVTIEDPIEREVTGINQVNINSKIHFHFSDAIRAFLRQDPDVMMIGEIRDSPTAMAALQAAQTGHLVLTTIHASDTQEAAARLQQLLPDSFSFSGLLVLFIAQRLIRKRCSHCHQGCAHCQQGYRGRTALFEFTPFDLPSSLSASGSAAVSQGITDLLEIKRVLGTQHHVSVNEKINP